MTIKDYFFSQHRPPTIRHFVPLGRCDCRWLHNDFSIPRAPENMSHKKEAILFLIFPHLDVINPYHCNILGLSRFFNKNIPSYLREASRTSSPRWTSQNFELVHINGPVFWATGWKFRAVGWKFRAAKNRVSLAGVTENLNVAPAPNRSANYTKICSQLVHWCIYN